MVTRKPSAITIYYTASQEETFVENLKKKSTLVHGCLLLLFGITHVYTIWFSWNKNRSIILDYLYLTHWNLTFHVFFLAIELLSDLSLSFDEMTIIFRNKFLHSILIPSSICVSIGFWAICIIFDENLIRGPPEERWPEWHNQISHTAILPAILIECMIVEHQLPKWFPSLMITIVIGSTYMFWVIFVGVVFQKHAYELIQNASATKLASLFLLLTILLIIANIIGRWLHIKYWRRMRRRKMINK
ncbi:androgen-induced 1 protein-like [Dermatophagoides farinae]|nr:androgen-induced 1 protein-like [Dermatophagoides farinae]